MARTRQARATTDQLTLDDWAGVLTEAPRIEAATPAGTSENGHQEPTTCADDSVERAARHHPVATDLLKTPGALLTRTHLRELGLERRAIDAVFRELPVVSLPGYSRPMIRVEQFVQLIREHTYRDDRVRAIHA
jgi:hypothetical protein